MYMVIPYISIFLLGKVILLNDTLVLNAASLYQNKLQKQQQQNQ